MSIPAGLFGDKAGPREEAQCLSGSWVAWRPLLWPDGWARVSLRSPRLFCDGVTSFCETKLPSPGKADHGGG